LTFNQKVLISTTHITEVITKLYFSILRNKITDKQRQVRNFAWHRAWWVVLFATYAHSSKIKFESQHCFQYPKTKTECHHHFFPKMRGLVTLVIIRHELSTQAVGWRGCGPPRTLVFGQKSFPT